MIIQNVHPATRVPDAELEQSIRRVLSEEYPRLIRDLKVIVRDGVATIEGKLANHRQVDEVLATILDVEGVADVRSDITINGRPYTRRSTKSVPESRLQN
jgi:osmotically-inducible protein OsmY